MQVQLTDKMGSDLTVVNSARVSYAKQSEFEDVYVEHGKFETYEKRLSAKDEKLIAYLAKHNHWSPSIIIGHLLLIVVYSLGSRLQFLLQGN